MRVIFEIIDREHFFEVILNDEDLETLTEKGDLIGDYLLGDERELTNINVYLRKEDFMPLVKGKKARSKEGFSENIKKEMEAGKPQKQAVAIAYSEARRSKKSKGKKK